MVNPTKQEIRLSNIRATARMLGLQASYLNPVFGDTPADPAILLKISEALSERRLDSNLALEQLREEMKEARWIRGIQPTIVAWGGNSGSVLMFLATDSKSSTAVALNEAEVSLAEEGSNALISSSHFHWQARPIRSLPKGTVWKLKLSIDLKAAGYEKGGYFSLVVRSGDQEYRSLVICPPLKLETNHELKHTEGPFLPLHAIRTGDEIGMGSLRELKLVAKDLVGAGAKWVSLFPLLPGKFESPDCDPSPYSSQSRLFWNEIYLDLEKAISRAGSETARSLYRSTEFQERAKQLREQDYADYFEVYQLKKRVLDVLATEFFERDLHTRPEYLNFLNRYSDLEAYVAFRTNDPREQMFHRYVQFEMDCQLREFSKETGLALYMDFPIGVVDGGFDQQEYKDIFFNHVSVGAPPEQVFRNGQDWGFSPFHPVRHRQSGYRYFRKALRHHLQFAKILRLDHVMGLFRVFAIPKGLSAKKGVYLRYAPEDLFAIAVLEASRAGADFIGENLGTVPSQVNEIMRAHGIKGMWVLEMETHRSPEMALSKVPQDQLICLNTHDMPMLSSFLELKDLPEVLRLGIIDEEAEASLRAGRERDLRPWIAKLGRAADGVFAKSAVQEIRKRRPLYFVINPEDLVGETRPLNIPGTYKEVPNWRRKFAFTGVPWVKADSGITN